jgi:hypothetical protein
MVRICAAYHSLAAPVVAQHGLAEKHPWFEKDLLPYLRRRVAKALAS